MGTDFSVKNKRLHYLGKAIGDSALSPGFQRFAFENAPLGEGGNGVTFRARHQALGVEQVVKLYFPGKGVADKAKYEATKNADPKLRDVIAQVHDAGTYSYPEEISYSVMESVSGIQTLKEWLRWRDSDWESALRRLPKAFADDVEGAKRWKSRRSRFVMAEALSVAAGFVGAVVRMHSNGVIHGDLNPGNILILQERVEKSHFERTTGEIPPGTLNLSPVKLIDLGSSQLIDTNATIGIARENWFVVENVRKILKPLFPKGGSVKSWMSLQETKLPEGFPTFLLADSLDPCNPRELSSEIFRLLCVLNIMLGHFHSWRDRETDDPYDRVSFDHRDVAILNELILGGTGELRDGIFDLDVLSVFRILSQPAYELYVRWQDVLDYWGSSHSGLPKLEIGHRGVRTLGD